MLSDFQNAARETSQQNQALADRIGIGLVLAGVCGAVAGLLLGFGTAQSIHRSLLEISVPVRDMAGRLNEVVGPIKVSSNFQLSELDGALRMLADKTADVVQRLQESQRESLRNEHLAAIGQLAAGMAHELRNPLMSMKLIVQMAGEQAGRPMTERDISVIEDEITRLEKMLQTFLDFARPPEPNIRPVDVGELVQSSIDIIRPRAEQQEVQLLWHAPAEAIVAELDASLFRQVLLNLFINALDALADGGRVWVDVSRVSFDHRTVHATRSAPHRGDSGPEQYALICVSDDGPGVAPDVFDRVFEPFVSTKITGIGLGLSISRRIVESHQGWIIVRNRQDRGAEFRVVLPMAARPLSGGDQQAPTADVSHPSSSDSAPLLRT